MSGSWLHGRWPSRRWLSGRWPSGRCRTAGGTGCLRRASSRASAAGRFVPAQPLPARLVPAEAVPGLPRVVGNLGGPGRGPSRRLLGWPGLPDALRVPRRHRIPGNRRIPNRSRTLGPWVAGRPGSGSRGPRSGPPWLPHRLRIARGRRVARRRRARRRPAPGPSRLPNRVRIPGGHGPPRRHFPWPSRLWVACRTGTPHRHAPSPARLPGHTWLPRYIWLPRYTWLCGRRRCLPRPTDDLWVPGRHGAPHRRRPSRPWVPDRLRIARGHRAPRWHMPGPAGLPDRFWIPGWRVSGGRRVLRRLRRGPRARWPDDLPRPSAGGQLRWPPPPRRRGRGDGPLAPAGHRWPGHRQGSCGNGGGLCHFGAGPNSAPPHPAGYYYFVLFGQWCHPAPCSGFTEVAGLRGKQLRQPFALQHRTGCQPGEKPRWEHVQPEQVVVERQPENGQQDDVGNRDSGKDSDLPHRDGHWQPEIVELVQPFLNPPDARIGGQFHRSLSLCRGRISGRLAPKRCPLQGLARCSGCRRSQRSRRRVRQTARTE
jgi:hypothetical protein